MNYEYISSKNITEFQSSKNILKSFKEINKTKMATTGITEMDIPDTLFERLEKAKKSDEPVVLHPNDPKIYDRAYNEKMAEKYAWSAPYDARFPQARKQRHCFAYYVDFFRCQELMGEDYKPCKFFRNVYRDMCPGFWIERWDELREEGRFPAKFDR